MTFKGKLHIPTEQYGFVEVDVETNSIEEMLSLYETAMNNRGSKGELNHLEWATIRDEFLNKGKVPSEEVWTKMTYPQKYLLQQVKLATKRK